jgi:hypothetical protein
VRSREHIIKFLSNYWQGQPSEMGLRSAAMLDAWVGLHHIPSAALSAVDWSNTLYQQILLSANTGCGSLSTYDFASLTRLVFLAHDFAIRLELSPHHYRFLKLMMHPRPRDGGNVSTRHPTLEAAVSDWRSSHPASEIFQ